MGWSTEGVGLTPILDNPNIIFMNPPRYVDNAQAASTYKLRFRDDVVHARNQFRELGISDLELDAELERPDTSSVVASIGARLRDLADRINDVE
jgi:hypothetical protein